jgi:hypothetical protein
MCSTPLYELMKDLSGHFQISTTHSKVIFGLPLVSMCISNFLKTTPSGRKVITIEEDKYGLFRKGCWLCLFCIFLKLNYYNLSFNLQNPSI